MMTTVVRRTPASPLAELLDWVEAGWPAAAEMRRGAHALRVEDRMDENTYVLRAELPGIDPDKDVEITVADHVLSIAAERQEAVSEKGRSEFHYGSFSRRVTLPKGAREDQLTATYRDGILEIRVPIEAATAESRSIPIARGASD
jgi:HSP20 family molecular chaperone IbpA